MSAVTAERVWKYFGDFPAIRDVSFTLETGQCLALLGRNGAGKTTLLRVLAGLSEAEGKVRIFGRETRDPRTRAAIGVLGHGIGVYEELSALENLKLFARLYGLSPQVPMEWLERTALEHVKNSLVREFSRGMRQRLALARVFIHAPSLLLLDEPFTSLDDQAVALLQSLLKEALQRGATVIMSTHQLREAMELATHAALLDRGKLSFFGPRPQEMLADPAWLYATYGNRGRTA